MFRRAARPVVEPAALEAVEALVRARFHLGPDDLVLVSEEAPRQPGFPSRATQVLFWRGDIRHRFQVFRPAADVGAADIPVSWLLPSLVDDGTADCC